MAFQTGSQVNAALGRTDYTPFLQGAMQGAQAQARGAENIAAGLAGLGQQVATGIEKYYKKEEEKKLNEQASETVANILETNPAFAKQLKLEPDASGKFDRKVVGVVVKSLGGAANTIQFANTLNEFTRKQTEDTQAAEQFNALRQSGGRAISPESGAISPTAEMKGYETYVKYLETQSQIAKNLAPKIPDLSLPEQQLAALRRDFVIKNNRPPTDIEDVKMMEKVQSSALPQPPVGESEFSKISAQNLAKRADDAILQGTKAQIGLENTTNLKAAIAAGAEQGPGSDVKILLMNAANVFLSPENKFDTTSSNISKLSFNELTLSTAEKIMKQGSITNSEREQAKDTSARITTEKDSALFYIAFKEASDKRKMMIAEKVNALQSEGVEDRKEYAKALDIKNYPPLDNPIYGDYGVKINALAAAAELAKRNPKKK
jgi:hypothetical protein